MCAETVLRGYGVNYVIKKLKPTDLQKTGQAGINMTSVRRPSSNQNTINCLLEKYYLVCG